MTFIWWIFMVGGGFVASISLWVDWSRSTSFEWDITFESTLGILIYFLTIYLIYKFIDSKYEIRRKS